MRYWTLYIAAVILVADVGILFSSETLGLTTASATRVAHLLMWIGASSYVAVLLTRVGRDPTATDTVGGIVLSALFSAPIATVVISTLHSEIVSNWSVLLALGVGILIFLGDIGNDATPLQYLAGIWAISSFMLQIGELSILPYSRRFVEATRAVHTLLDIRIGGAAILLGVVLVSALTRALRLGPIEVEDVPQVHMPAANPAWHPLWTAFMTPIINIVDALLQVVRFIANFLSKLIVAIFVFFRRVGDATIEIVLEIMKTHHFIRGLAFASLAWVGFLAMFSAACKFCHSIGPYLLALAWLRSIPPLVVMFVLALCMAASGALIVWALERTEFGVLSIESAFVVSNFLAVVLIAGLVLIVLARIDALALATMRRPGPYSLMMLILVLTAVPAWITRARPHAPPAGRSSM